MSVVYVIQVMAYHGVGTQGWRTVGPRAGQPFLFRTREAAIAAMRRHFGNLREGINVRVQAVHEQGPSSPSAATPADSCNAPDTCKD